MTQWWAAHWAEVVGFVSGAGCVVLAARRSIWTFPVGIVQTVVYLVLFASAALYADAALQLVFLALALHGWLLWARRAADTADRAVRSTPRAAVLPLVAGGIAATALLTGVLTAFTDSTTQLADAAVTAGSLVAQLMLNRRWIGNWGVWIGVDLLSVGLYAAKGLWITALLYLVFLVLCIDGLHAWRREAREVAAPAGPGGEVVDA